MMKIDDSNNIDIIGIAFPKMKQQKQASTKQIRKNQIIETIDGPPLDFSFKNIRSLNQLIDNISTVALKPEVSQQKNWNLSGNVTGSQIQKQGNTRKNHNAINSNDQKTQLKTQQQKQTVEQPKLQIIRTIQINDQSTLQSQHKKATVKKQNTEKKIKKIILPQTTALFLRYNKITSIQNFNQFVAPVFPNLGKNLMWVDLSHNRIAELTTDLGELENLKTLYLHVNYISDFGELEKLKKATLLRILTIHANPLQQYSQFRIIIHSILPGLKKIDSTLLTWREAERAKVLMKSIKKYPVIKNVRKLQESQNEEDD